MAALIEPSAMVVTVWLDDAIYAHDYMTATVFVSMYLSYLIGSLKYKRLVYKLPFLFIVYM